MIYLDNNATTPIDPRAREAMLPFLGEHFANPSSGYRAAKAVKAAVGKAREQVASLLKVTPEEIVFTSCGTEADNAAIESAIKLLPDRRHIVTVASEHDAVINYCTMLEAERGYEVTRLGVDQKGQIDLGELDAAIRPDETAVVSVMWANNETGVIQPVLEAAECAAAKGAYFHTDAVQATGKISMDLAGGPIHYLAISGHKLHAPKGVGVLYVRKSARFEPFFIGGGQEGGRRAGTENVPYLVAIGEAAAVAEEHLVSHSDPSADPVFRLRERFEKSLGDRLKGVSINGSEAARTPNTTSIRFDGADAQGVIILLDEEEICCSAGSACTTGSVKPSHVLTAMGLTPDQARETLRFSFSRFTTEPDVDVAIDAVVRAVTKLRDLRSSASGPVLSAG